jgi:hypothetical protein
MGTDEVAVLGAAACWVQLPAVSIAGECKPMRSYMLTLP